MSMGNWRTPSFVAAESILLLSLLTLALLVFRNSITNEAILEMGFWKNVAAIFVCFAVYWAMQTLGRNLSAFWLIATLVILAQGLAIWPHNALEWSQFFGVEVSGAEGRSLIKDTILLLVSLMGLMALNRIIGLRRLDGLLIVRQVGTIDRNSILLNEGLVLAGLIVCGAILAFLMVLTASSLGQHQNVLSISPWSVMTVGGSAAVLFVSSILVWLTRR